MGTMTSQITSLPIVYLIVYSGADHRKHQSIASLACVRGIHRWPVISPHKWPVTRKMFPFDDVIIYQTSIYQGIGYGVGCIPLVIRREMTARSWIWNVTGVGRDYRYKGGHKVRVRTLRPFYLTQRMNMLLNSRRASEIPNILPWCPDKTHYVEYA